MKKLLIILLISITHLAWADEGVDITNPAQVSALQNLQEKLDSVATAIMGCMSSGKSHNACMCKHKELIVEFNKTANKLFLDYPGLKELDLVRFQSPEGESVAQSLKNIRKQASIEPSCT
jgi:hypothetical protein